MSKNVRRLYERFRPNNYQLELQIDPEALTFSGNVTITGKKVSRPSQRITFHQKGLDIDEATIRRADKKGEKVYAVSRINKQAAYDEVRLHCGEMLYPGEYVVMLNFRGKITRNMEGIYPCFFEQDGKQQKLIATQFESHAAREVFPCIDEPEAKATFDLTLITPKGEPVIANTPVKSQKTVGAKTESQFETTPKMSTYLLAFAYGDMKYKESRTKDGVLVRTYATPANVQFTDFALEVAVKCLEFYNDYFDTPYPLAKCDLIALPDFASGAMENWGLITFREQCMLVDPDNTSLPVKQYVAMVVAHELAHQWFGNLVTMRWWSDLWLNEGFASWIEYLATNKLFPEWQMWTQFVVDEQQQALKLDALEHTHPIEVPIHHPDEIRTIFDAISYSKGSSVIHMLEHYLGRETFRDGLRLYLKRHAYGNTDTVDLWAALEEVSQKPVKSFMHAWTAQAGFPIVHAHVGNRNLELTQERFYLNPAAKKADVVWPFPLLASANVETETVDKPEQKLVVNQPSDIFLLNSGRSGLYRTVYDTIHTGKLAAAVEAGKLTPLDRLGILSDAFEAAKAGYSGTVEALKLLDSYQEEDNNVVWDTIAASLGSVRAVMNDTAVRETMKPYVRQLVAKQLTRLGWDEKSNDSHFDKLLRPTILGMAAISDQPAVVEEALKRFHMVKEAKELAPNLRGIVYTTAARRGGKAEFNKLMQLYSATISSEEHVTLAAALTNFEQAEFINKALATVQTDKVRLQDASYWIAYSFGNRFASDITWQWLMDNWQWLDERLGTDLSFYRLPLYAARNFSDDKFLPSYEKFFNSVTSPGLERAIKQGIETIQWQAAWRARDLKLIKAFFKA